MQVKAAPPIRLTLHKQAKAAGMYATPKNGNPYKQAKAATPICIQKRLKFKNRRKCKTGEISTSKSVGDVLNVSCTIFSSNRLPICIQKRQKFKNRRKCKTGEISTSKSVGDVLNVSCTIFSSN